MDGNLRKFIKPKPVPMVICAVAKCTKCQNKENFYIDERTKDTIYHTCKTCGNDKFEIIYK